VKHLRNAGGYLLDRPSTVTFLLGLIVAMHFFASWLWFPFISPASLFYAVPEQDFPNAVASLAIGLAAVAAMVGGFAGVVVVFGLSSADERFRLVRINASTSLRRNWMSIVTTPLAAAFGAIVAATLATASLTSPALWILEVCLLLAAHGAVRLIVLLNELVRVVHYADEAAQKAASMVDGNDFFED